MRSFILIILLLIFSAPFVHAADMGGNKKGVRMKIVFPFQGDGKIEANICSSDYRTADGCC